MMFILKDIFKSNDFSKIYGKNSTREENNEELLKLIEKISQIYENEKETAVMERINYANIFIIKKGIVKNRKDDISRFL